MKKKSDSSPKPSRGHGKRDMAVLLERCGIRLPEKALEQLWSYHNLLRRYNPELNLTRIHNFANMVVKLYVDSILPGQMIDLPGVLLDLGSGPGMPGIPLKIAFPGTRIILAESRGVRVEFLEMAVKELGLDGISVTSGITPKYTEPVSGVITRAVETIDRTLERIQGCLDENGRAIFMKGPGCDPEIEAAITKFSGRYRLVENRPYQIPHSPHTRRLVIFERTEAPMRARKEKAMTRHRVREIESEANDTFKDLKKLLTGRGIKKQEKALIAGTKQVDEILAAFPGQCLAWLSAPGHLPPPDDAPDSMAWYRLSEPLFRILDVSGTNAPLLLVRTPKIGTWQPADGFADGCSLLVPFQDPENVGAVIRSAIAFGARRIILLAESAHPYHPKAVRSSGGAVLHAELFQGPPLKELPPDLPIVALSAEGADIAELDFPEAFGLLAGIEGPGLPESLRENAVSIPISKDVESLNAATAAAIALYVWDEKQGKNPAK